MKATDYLKLALSILINLLAGFIGSIFTNPQIPTWYASLKKPSFSPPNWLFGPVWTALFILMGVSLFLVWRKGLNQPSVKIALTIFGAQLLLNILWSFLFFAQRSPLAGFIEIILLWILILITIIVFYPISKPAALLLIPYVLWVSFAAILNFSVWRLNQ